MRVASEPISIIPFTTATAASPIPLLGLPRGIVCIIQRYLATRTFTWEGLLRFSNTVVEAHQPANWMWGMPDSKTLHIGFVAMEEDADLLYIQFGYRIGYD